MGASRKEPAERVEDQGDEPLAPEGVAHVHEPAGAQLHVCGLGGARVRDLQLHPVAGRVQPLSVPERLLDLRARSENRRRCG